MNAEERVIFDEVKAALAAEQREHVTTRQQLTAAHEELVHEKGEHDFTTKKVDHLMVRCDGYSNELIEERKINNAAMKPSAKVLQQDQEDEIACIAEEVEGLKYRLTIATEYGNTLLNESKELNQKIESLELVEVALRTDVSRLECYKVELESSAETQGRHMQQVDAARKSAEAKVIEQRKALDHQRETIKKMAEFQPTKEAENLRAKVQEQLKEIEALNSGDDLWICPSVDTCNPMHKCGHREPHPHKDTGGGCNYRCRLATGICVKIDTCKECATLREEIINRDAVILEQERKADRADDVMRNALEQLKELRRCDETHKNIMNGRRIIPYLSLDTPELHQGYQPRANCVRKLAIIFSGKAGDIQTASKKHACKWYSVCTLASETSYACINNEGQHCGRRREIDAAHGVKL